MKAMTKIQSATVTAVAALLILSSTAAWGQVACGDVIAKDTVMTADLDCPSSNVALTVQGPAVLDMAGHGIRSCAGEGIGVLITGERARLENGFVRRCGIGIQLAGKSHTVEGVAAAENSSYGFAIGGRDQRVERCAAEANGGDGFAVVAILGVGGDHVLVDNVAAANYGSGFSIGGSRGQYRHNIAVDNEQSGYRVSGDDNYFWQNIAAGGDHEGDGFEVTSSRNRLYQNLALDNLAGDGLRLEGEGEVGNQLVGNIAVGAGLAGIEADNATTVFDNLVVDNEREGIIAAGSATKLRKNRVYGHFRAGLLSLGSKQIVSDNSAMSNQGGIVVGPSSGVEITGNLAVANNIDLHDQHPTCGGHVWSKNIFSTAAPTCAQ